MRGESDSWNIARGASLQALCGRDWQINDTDTFFKDFIPK